jgi:hypothetical protein
VGLTSFIIKPVPVLLSTDFSYSDTVPGYLYHGFICHCTTYFHLLTDMDDGLNGRSDSAFDESTMDTERDEDDGCGDEEEEVAQVSDGDGAASSVATANLCLPRPLSHHATALGISSAVKESALCDTSPLLLESSCGIVAAGSSSSSSTLPCSSSNSSCSSSSVTRLEQLARLNNKTIICDIEDPKPGPSNSAADFDLEVIWTRCSLFYCY